jgi:Uma2 family endonuclease
MSMTLQERLATGKYKLKVDDYALLGEIGAFGDASTELIDGDIIVMSPEWRPHMRVKDEIAYRLRRALEAIDATLFVGTGGSVALGDHEMPRPDILLTSQIEGEHAVPGASVALLVEVSTSTLTHDLTTKAALYAAAGMPEYWVVDVNERLIHQMWAPAGDGFAKRRESGFGDPIASTTIDGVTIATSGL